MLAQSPLSPLLYCVQQRHSASVAEIHEFQAALTAIDIDGEMHLDVICSETKQLGKEALLLGALCNIARVESFLL